MSLDPVIITWFDWVKLIVPGVVTGTVAVVAAYFAYSYARRGRKEDILYKERYKLYESLDEKLEVIHKMSSEFYSYVDSVLFYMRHEPEEWFSPDLVRAYPSEQVRARSVRDMENSADRLDNQMIRDLNNKRIELMFGLEIRDEVNEVRNSIRNSVNQSSDIAWCALNLPRDAEEHRELDKQREYWKNHNLTNNTNGLIDKLRESLFLSLELPVRYKRRKDDGVSPILVDRK